ncbi:type IV pilus twitching motility protein PilT [Armatimonas sp.]|uniref:type IV pilus twitching motility protein PilT n=1 Tax=Armatimonas sp. TaxID=1872638 RepID=UPI00286D6274|nr:type IV pilus twitching motility protein PilT [Armatimonas sp.]
MYDIRDLIRQAYDLKASDLFIKADSPPMLRLHGRIVPVEGTEKLSGDETRRMAYSIMSHEQIGRFEHRHELDIGWELDGLTRVRTNIYQQRGTIGVVSRLVPLKLYTLEQLGMPPAVGELTKARQGLMLITGPTGSGKSTTLAGMINKINEEQSKNIVTIEDPIEFVHPDKKCIISQREVGIDTDSFSDALKYVLRQNPDIILIGEMRDVESVSVALQAAETGHLVFGTLHTSSAAETLERIVNLFPPEDKMLLCMRMSQSVRGFIAQKLLPRVDTVGRVAAVEIMIATPTVAKLIEEGKTGNIYTAIQEGGFWGMQTMNQCLTRYYKAGIISEDDAMAAAGNLTELRQMIRRPGT